MTEGAARNWWLMVDFVRKHEESHVVGQRAFTRLGVCELVCLNLSMNCRIEKSVNDDDGCVWEDDDGCCCSMGGWHSTCSTINVRQERREETNKGQERGAKTTTV
jgi:hypothetical protein